MIRLLSCSLLISLALLTACGKKEAEPMSAPAPAAEAADGLPAAGSAQLDASSKQGASAGPEATPQRYLAVHHFLTLESEADQVEKNWQTAQAKCLSLGCEILDASLQRNQQDHLPSASLSLRLPPKQVNAFFDVLKQGGEILSQQTTTEDKTDAVVDVEARLKNYIELRDRLRQMIASKDGKLADVLAVHKELADTQAEIDRITGMRKALANETEKVAININFEPIRTVAERGIWEPLRNAWRRSGYNLTNGLADVIHFITSAIPWLLVAAPIIWWWRRRRRARQQ
ncbi:hypothetical protein HNQ59_000394 [Chitinivorax tropicus]|uniref:DUF4349 domain-containing protein n=1 Tax=Chitinivorax tropicus TaxID=714531 RepID=A0A840MKA2_9PROT|nr:DUF4349 domain-containing protein [Chitinivorax tropicus]MBB5017132.1 hypothetical protein [Chitinivorax tropicus]